MQAFCPWYLALDEDLCRVEVEYLTLPGWKTDTSGARKFTDLPQNAQNYVHKIEELVGVPGMLVYLSWNYFIWTEINSDKKYICDGVK